MQNFHSEDCKNNEIQSFFFLLCTDCNNIKIDEKIFDSEFKLDKHNLLTFTYKIKTFDIISKKIQNHLEIDFIHALLNHCKKPFSFNLTQNYKKYICKLQIFW